MFSQLKQVYNLMQDEESREIFLNRALYNITGEKRYIDKIVSFYAERVKERWKSGEYAPNIRILREKINNRKVIIYGIGQCGFVTLLLFQYVMKDIEVIAFCDKKADRINEFYGYQVVPIDILLRDHQDAVVLVTPTEPKSRDEIVTDLITRGFNKNQIIEQVTFDLWALRGQYFDEQVIFCEGDVFVDVGCLNCITSMDFIKRCPNYGKIIAFEPNPLSYNNCLKIVDERKIRDMKLYNIGLWNEKDNLPFIMLERGGSSRVSKEGTISVQLDALDHILQGEKVSFLKMDIEGAELNALRGGKTTLLLHKPTLAICVYHKPEDIIEIPLYIQSVVPEYKFYMRHYSKAANETVLYAVPV